MIAMGLPLAPAHIQALATRTEGWVGGLQLAALAMRDRTNIAEFITSFTGSNRYIVDYLLEHAPHNGIPLAMLSFTMSSQIQKVSTFPKRSRECALACSYAEEPIAPVMGERF
jgi:hypothetical protein